MGRAKRRRQKTKYCSTKLQLKKKWKQLEVPKRETPLSQQTGYGQKKSSIAVFFLFSFFFNYNYALGKDYPSTFSADSQARYN